MKLLLALLLVGTAAAPAGAALNLVDARVFPVPWKPGSGDPALDVPAVTIDRLAPNTEVTIFTVRGQRVWKGVSNAAGVLLWKGLNDAGRMVGSGTYVAVLSGGGAKTTRRIFVVR